MFDFLNLFTRNPQAISAQAAMEMTAERKEGTEMPTTVAETHPEHTLDRAYEARLGEALEAYDHLDEYHPVFSSGIDPTALLGKFARFFTPLFQIGYEIPVTEGEEGVFTEKLMPKTIKSRILGEFVVALVQYGGGAGMGFFTNPDKPGKEVADPFMGVTLRRLEFITNKGDWTLTPDFFKDLEANNPDLRTPGGRMIAQLKLDAESISKGHITVEGIGACKRAMKNLRKWVLRLNRERFSYALVIATINPGKPIAGKFGFTTSDGLPVEMSKTQIKTFNMLVLGVSSALIMGAPKQTGGARDLFGNTKNATVGWADDAMKASDARQARLLAKIKAGKVAEAAVDLTKGKPAIPGTGPSMDDGLSDD